MTIELKNKVLKASEALKNKDMDTVRQFMKDLQDLSDDSWEEVIKVIQVNGSIATL
jgi:hypothetical protein